MILNKMSQHFYIKIITVIAVSFFLSQWLVSEIFIGSTPRLGEIRYKELLVKVTNGVNQIISKVNLLSWKGADNFNTIQKNSTIKSAAKLVINRVNPDQSPKEWLKDISFTQVTKGIYRKEDAQIVYFLIKEEEVVWVNYELILAGEKKLILIPSSTTNLYQSEGP